MKKSKKIGLSLNKKTISSLSLDQVKGGSSMTNLWCGGSGACGSGGGSTNNTGSYCACK